MDNDIKKPHLSYNSERRMWEAAYGNYRAFAKTQERAYELLIELLPEDTYARVYNNELS